MAAIPAMSAIAARARNGRRSNCAFSFLPICTAFTIPAPGMRHARHVIESAGFGWLGLRGIVDATRFRNEAAVRATLAPHRLDYEQTRMTNSPMTRKPAAPASPPSTVRAFRIVLGIVALLALVFGVIALNTMGDTHDTSAADHGSVAAVPAANAPTTHAVAGTRISPSATVSDGGQQCGETCAMGCVMVGIACAVGLTALLTSAHAEDRPPAQGQAPPHPWVRPVLDQLRATVATPSLIALSISRT